MIKDADVFICQKYQAMPRGGMISIKLSDDIGQRPPITGWILLFTMFFSKSFGYALRSVLYVAAEQNGTGKLPLDKIAEDLAVPRHFLGKVMKRLVKEGILSSQKGPNGGFCTNENTLATPLIRLIYITEDNDYFKTCVLRLRKCNSLRPCPLHLKAESLRDQWEQLFSTTSINDLLKKEQPNFLESISLQ